MSEPPRARRRWLGPLGWITGVSSVILGAAGVGAVLCLWYPALLTTPALRDVYDMRLIRGLIKAGLIAAFVLGLYAIPRAAPVITPAVRARPSATEAVLSPVRR